MLAVWCLLGAGVLAGLPVIAAATGDEPYADFDAGRTAWRVGNGKIEIAFGLSPEGSFGISRLLDKSGGRQWLPPAGRVSCPVAATMDGVALSGSTRFRLMDHFTEAAGRGGLRQVVILSPAAPACEVRFELVVYAQQPVIRYRTLLRNTAARRVYVTAADMLPWVLDASGGPFRGLMVGQWSWGGDRANFEPHEIDFSQLDSPVEAFTGAYGNHSTWGALRDPADHGLFFGWEFDGRARAHAGLDASRVALEVDALIQRLNHPVEPDDTFSVPWAFVGAFRGDWDEAGYRTQRFVEAALAPPIPDSRFPYVAFDSWGYQWDINEAVLREAAERAAGLGVELFTVDFGWAKVTGDWTPDPAKFPNGLKPLSDYVRSLGMKFGLHMPFAEAALDSRVLREHPDWKVENDGQRAYFEAAGLCLSHRPAREWVIAEILRVVRENGVDWLLQDGENMVKRCDASHHSHDAQDSNYANAVDGLQEVLRAVREAEPGLLLENCEDGGNMQTFSMTSNYVTSIVNDNSDMLTTRKSIYGATYPFPPRFTDRYMETTPWSTYHTRSHFFGGPLILMQKITEWPDWMASFARHEIGIYKAIRERIRDGKIYHLTPPPDGTFHDAMQAHDETADVSVLIAFRPEGAASEATLRPRGLQDARIYRVRVEGRDGVLTAAGSALRRDGIRVVFDSDPGAEIVHIEPAH